MNGADEVFIAAGVAKLLADGADMALEQGGIVDVLVAPDLLREEGMRECLAGVADKLGEDIHLEPRAVQVDPAEVRGRIREVEFQPVGLNLLAHPFERGRGGIGAPQHGAHPGDELAGMEGLGEIVIATTVEPGDDIAGTAERGQENDTKVLVVLLQLAANLKPGAVWENDIEDGETRWLALGELQGGAGGARDYDFVRFSPQCMGDNFGIIRVVFHYK